MKVHALIAGYVDAEEETLCGLYKEQADAISAAVAAVEELFDKDPNLTESGYVYEVTEDSSNNPIVIVSIDNKEVEWWRIVEHEVH